MTLMIALLDDDTTQVLNDSSSKGEPYNYPFDEFHDLPGTAYF